MTKRDIFTKLGTYQTLLKSDLISVERLQASIAQAIERKEIKKLKEADFEKHPDLLEFARSIGLIKLPRDPNTPKKAFGAKAEDGADTLVATQHPDWYAANVAPSVAARGTIVEIVRNGVPSKVQFMPFWRTVKEKKVVTNEGGTTGTVTV